MNDGSHNLVGRTPRSAPDALVRLLRRPANAPELERARPGGRAADEGVRPNRRTARFRICP
jgi:hypothetical protein